MAREPMIPLSQTAALLRGFLAALEEAGALKVPAADLEDVVRRFTPATSTGGKVTAVVLTTSPGGPLAPWGP